ncbi:hypothetical protein DFP72DRAFT_853932 [Ephemerocybe angulata]|uniref:Uncharacterized protein n=1 Tax=Ephemerocybe angulata TaxID=980116 RepID=A0A8H6HKM9_9AGAR|nr:hypothetical protein DFP72DRAFT_853932 [Tulosesus angulatus]
MRECTGFSPFYAVHGVKSLLLFDILHATFIFPNVCTQVSEDQLFAMRAQQLEQCNEDLATLHDCVLASCFASIDSFIQKHQHSIVEHDFSPGDLIFILNKKVEPDLGRKAKPGYYGPMAVSHAAPAVLIDLQRSMEGYLKSINIMEIIGVEDEVKGEATRDSSKLSSRPLRCASAILLLLSSLSSFAPPHSPIKSPLSYKFSAPTHPLPLKSISQLLVTNTPLFRQTLLALAISQLLSPTHPQPSKFVSTGPNPMPVISDALTQLLGYITGWLLTFVILFAYDEQWPPWILDAFKLSLQDWRQEHPNRRDESRFYQTIGSWLLYCFDGWVGKSLFCVAPQALPGDRSHIHSAPDFTVKTVHTSSQPEIMVLFVEVKDDLCITAGRVVSKDLDGDGGMVVHLLFTTTKCVRDLETVAKDFNASRSNSEEELWQFLNNKHTPPPNGNPDGNSRRGWGRCGRAENGGGRNGSSANGGGSGGGSSGEGGSPVQAIRLTQNERKTWQIFLGPELFHEEEGDLEDEDEHEQKDMYKQMDVLKQKDGTEDAGEDVKLVGDRESSLVIFRLFNTIYYITNDTLIDCSVWEKNTVERLRLQEFDTPAGLNPLVVIRFQDSNTHPPAEVELIINFGKTLMREGYCCMASNVHKLANIFLAGQLILSLSFAPTSSSLEHSPGSYNLLKHFADECHKNDIDESVIILQGIVQCNLLRMINDKNSKGPLGSKSRTRGLGR